MKWDAAINVLDNIFRFILTVICLNLGLGIFGVGAAYLIAAFISFCFSIFIFLRYFGKFEFRLDLPLWGLALREMRFLALVAALIPLFGKFDAVILSYFKGDESVGLYGASLKLVWMLIFIPSFITQAAFPRLSQHAANNDSRFNSLIGYLLKSNFVLTFFGSLLIYFFARPIIFLIYGSEYMASVQVLRVLIWCLPLHGLNGVFIYGLNARNKQKVNALFIGAMLLLNILFAVILVPRFSYMGASFATFTSLFVLLVVFMIYYLRKGYIQPKDIKITPKDLGMLKNIFSPEEVIN